MGTSVVEDRCGYSWPGWLKSGSFLGFTDSMNLILHWVRSSYSCIKLLLLRFACGHREKQNHLPQISQESHFYLRRIPYLCLLKNNFGDYISVNDLWRIWFLKIIFKTLRFLKIIVVLSKYPSINMDRIY